MPAFLEVWTKGVASLLTLDGEVLIIGRGATNDLVLADDPTVSRTHAVLQRYGSTWCIRDMGSSNGTLVNSQRITGEQHLAGGDEIVIGDCRMKYRSPVETDRTETLTAEGPPVLTRKEHEVLVALCAPMRSGEPFSQPSTVKEMAEKFTVSVEAIKFHLRNLYDKFRIYGNDSSKRVALANAAVRSGAVSQADLAPPLSDPRTAAPEARRLPGNEERYPIGSGVENKLPDG